MQSKEQINEMKSPSGMQKANASLPSQKMKSIQMTSSKPSQKLPSDKLKTQTQSALQQKHDAILKNILSSNIVKPTNVEAQRILKILEELLMNIEVLCVIDSNFVDNFYDLSKSNLNMQEIQNLAQETLNWLRQQAEFEGKHRDLELEEEKSRLDEEKKQKEKEEAVSDDDDEVSQDSAAIRRDEQKKKENREDRKKKMSINDQLLVNNLKHLLRHLRMNHEDYLRLKNMKTNQNPQMLDILQCIMSMNIIMQKKLSTAAEEKKSHINQIQDLTERINQLTESKENQEKDLEKIKKQRKQFQDEKREEIEKYKKGLEDVKKKKDDKIKQLEMKTQQTLESLKKEYEKKNKLEEALKNAREEFEKLYQANKKIEDGTLKKNKQGKDEYLKSTYENYDKEMEELTQQKIDLENEYGIIKKELQEKLMHFKNIDSEKAREAALEKAFKEKQEQKAADEGKKHHAAYHIQLAYKQFKGGKKKKKKGKKKAKK